MSKAQLHAFVAKVQADAELKIRVDHAADAAAVAAIEIDEDFVGCLGQGPGAGGEDGLAAERHGRSLGDFALRESVLKTEQNRRGEARWG